MAISTIKFDENGEPKRAKYRIVVLGHLDQNKWSKQDTYALVLSLIELRLMITLSIYFKRILKSGDFKLEQKTNVDFMGPVTHFLGHKFQWQSYNIDSKPQLRLHLSQTAYADHLVDIAKLSQSSKPVLTPYRSGNPVDSIMNKPTSPAEKHSIQDQMRQLVGSLN